MSGREDWPLGRGGHHGGPGRRHGRRGEDFPGRGFGRGFGGRRAGRGDVRASVLALLSEQPQHGYQIITELSERSGGAWHPSPGSVYPLLQQLQDEGLVLPEEESGRRVFHLTDAGQAYVDEHREELQSTWESVKEDAQGAQLIRLLRQVMVATRQVAQAGSSNQVTQAGELLAETRRALYRLLAEDEVEEGNSQDG